MTLLTDDGADDLEVTVMVEAGHFRGFAAQKGALAHLTRRSHPLKDLGHDGRIQLPRAHVVEKEERPRTLDEDVVDRVVDDVVADRVVALRLGRDQDLGADPVGRCHE